MPKPYKNIQFIENNIYGSPYIIQPDIPAWKDTTTSFTQQIDLVSYEHINICFDNQNSDKSCKILCDRIIKEIERVYRKLDVFEENALRFNLTTTSYEGLIVKLKRLKSIGAVNPDMIPLQYFLLDVLDF